MGELLIVVTAEHRKLFVLQSVVKIVICLRKNHQRSSAPYF